MPRRPSRVDDSESGAPSGVAAFLGRARTSHGTEVADEIELRRFVTESPALNRATSLGGLPLGGRYIVVYGPWGGGKSTLAARILGDVYRAGGIGYYADVERAAVKQWFRSCGCPDEGYVYAKHRSQEEVQDGILDFLRDVSKGKENGDIEKDVPVLVVVDTITRLVPADKLSGAIGSKDYGLSANLLNDWLRVALVVAGEAGATIVLVSQERKGKAPFPNAPDWMFSRPTTGDAVRFDASLELRVEIGKQIKVDGSVVGKTHRIRVTKSKLGTDHRSHEIPCYFTSNGEDSVPLGLDIARELISEALNLEVIRKPVTASGRQGARMEASWDSSLSWRGEKALRESLGSDPDLVTEFRSRISTAIDDIARGMGHRV